MRIKKLYIKAVLNNNINKVECKYSKYGNRKQFVYDNNINKVECK